MERTNSTGVDSNNNPVSVGSGDTVCRGASTCEYTQTCGYAGGRTIELLSMFYGPQGRSVSLMRVMSFMSLIAAITFGLLESYGHQKHTLTILFLTGAFCPKLLQGVLENQILSLLGKAGVNAQGKEDTNVKS